MLSFADTARPVPLDRLPELLQALLPHLPIARASWIVTQLTHRVESGQSHRIRPYELRDGDDFLLGAVLLDQPASSTSLLAFHGPLIGQSNDHERSLPLLDLIRRQLADANIRFIQTCVDEEVDALRLGQLGFEVIAELALMVFELSATPNSREQRTFHSMRPGISATPSEMLTFLAVDQDASLVHRLCRLAEASFESTFDCPRLASFRSPQDITAGFCLADSAAPELWRLVQIGQEDAGCIFLTPHRQRDANDQVVNDGIVALELTYMALLPKFRRRGIAQSVLMETVRVARNVGAQRIVLAVDNENLPAKKLYQRAGWVEVATETVLGSRISA